MAHYDCSNCGERMGIAFGSCKSCTPEEYHTLRKRISQIHKDAEDLWKAKYADALLVIEQRHKEFVEKYIAAMAAEPNQLLHELEMKHHHGYRYTYEWKKRTELVHPISGNTIHVAPGEQIPLFG